jgi:hypothetical protein
VSDEDALGALTVLVAVCDRAAAELEELDPRRDLLLHHIEKTRDAAVEAARQLGESDQAKESR